MVNNQTNTADRIIVVIITTDFNEYKRLVERTQSWIEWT